MVSSCDRKQVAMKRWSIVRPDPTLQDNLMAFGFECGRGWLPLVYETLDKIQAIVDRDRLDLEITQVKEKYGELRIYTSSYADEIEDIIQEATEKSVTICERCGKEGKRVQVKGWLMTRCDECFRSHKKEGEE